MLMNTPNVPAQDNRQVPRPTPASRSRLRPARNPSVVFAELADKHCWPCSNARRNSRPPAWPCSPTAEGDSVKSWSSKMVVVGNLKTSPPRRPRWGELARHCLCQGCGNGGYAQKQRQRRPPANERRVWLAGRRGAKGQTEFLIAAFSGGLPRMT